MPLPSCTTSSTWRELLVGHTELFELEIVPRLHIDADRHRFARGAAGGGDLHFVLLPAVGDLHLSGLRLAKLSEIQPRELLQIHHRSRRFFAAHAGAAVRNPIGDEPHRRRAFLRDQIDLLGMPSHRIGEQLLHRLIRRRIRRFGVRRLDHIAGFVDQPHRPFGNFDFLLFPLPDVLDPRVELLAQIPKPHLLMSQHQIDRQIQHKRKHEHRQRHQVRRHEQEHQQPQRQHRRS